MGWLGDGVGGVDGGGELTHETHQTAPSWLESGG